MTVHRLTKHHGLGNDFLIALDPDSPIGSDHATLWCDRRVGIGADGLIIGTKVDGRWQMVLWNADGSRAEISGNGIRCLGQAITNVEQPTDPTGGELEIMTDAGLRMLRVLSSDEETMMLRVGMGKATEGPESSDRWGEVGIEPIAQAGVDIGNPHLVAVVASHSDADMATIGPAIEADYPAGVNVHLVEVESPNALRLLIWERGAGVTQACGSGACASVWAANRLGLVDAKVTVSMPGGEASIDLAEDEIFLTGPATRVGEVLISE